MGKPSAPDAPPPRDLRSEILQTYQGQSQTAAPYFNLESYFEPKYGQLGLSNLQQQLLGYDVPAGGPPAAPGATTSPLLNKRGLPAGNALQAKRGQVTDPYAGLAPSQTPGHHAGLLELGGAATQGLLAANPFLASSLTNLLGRTADSPILNTLNQQAQQALALGGQLSPQDIRASDQAARAAYSARGLVGGQPAAAAEVLNRDAAMRQRIAAAQQLASGVQGLNQQQSDLVGRASQVFSSTLGGPFQAILGYGGGGGGQQIGTGARLFDPTNAYAQDIYNTNYNAQAAANIAGSNQQAAQGSALIGAGGAVAGGLIAAL